jgi:hypothetical protein
MKKLGFIALGACLAATPAFAQRTDMATGASTGVAFADDTADVQGAKTIVHDTAINSKGE